MASHLNIAIAQLNPTVGALRDNTNRAIQIMGEMEIAGADLLVFPEMFIPGYPPQDLILENHFVTENMKIVEEIGRASCRERV